jgi:hypothetical protein
MFIHSTNTLLPLRVIYILKKLPNPSSVKHKLDGVLGQ